MKSNSKQNRPKTQNTERQKKKSFFKRIGRKCQLIQIYIKENNNQHR